MTRLEKNFEKNKNAVNNVIKTKSSHFYFSTVHNTILYVLVYTVTRIVILPISSLDELVIGVIYFARMSQHRVHTRTHRRPLQKLIFITLKLCIHFIVRFFYFLFYCVLKVYVFISHDENLGRVNALSLDRRNRKCTYYCDFLFFIRSMSAN